ncbi:hypothetical protein HNY73_010972 [Argiope bruennichi]|uniref:Uncharacterized protein n=1 Tax=Argiope bruennichi TaxID=94029 RepID=A0A8T0F2R8_ARGBR|nr:hypothetical protein HNY73_010972 [Argiope bruennichi]
MYERIETQQILSGTVKIMPFKKRICLLKLKEKVTTYEDNNIEVACEENHFAVVIVTPVTKRSWILSTS